MRKVLPREFGLSKTRGKPRRWCRRVAVWSGALFVNGVLLVLVGHVEDPILVREGPVVAIELHRAAREVSSVASQRRRGLAVEDIPARGNAPSSFSPETLERDRTIGGPIDPGIGSPVRQAIHRPNPCLVPAYRRTRDESEACFTQLARTSPVDASYPVPIDPEKRSRFDAEARELKDRYQRPMLQPFSACKGAGSNFGTGCQSNHQ